MKNLSIKIIFLISALFIIISSCNQDKKDKSYIKKIALNDETIAVGVYKATGFDYPDCKYISEALNIDGGVVYVTLTDADVLKTRLENIDVVIFPAIKDGQIIESIDDEIAGILKKFASTKGKGIIGICNSCCFLSSSIKNQSLELVNLKIKKGEEKSYSPGLVKFQLTSHGKEIFPELESSENLFLAINNPLVVNFEDTTIKVAGKKVIKEKEYPLFLSSKYGDGKIFITNAHPEKTPGMRWMIPRIVRWVFNKELVSYDNNVFSPDLFNHEIVLTEDIKAKIENLKKVLENGDNNEKIKAIDALDKIYPWAGAEEIVSLLHDKNNDVKLRAAKYFADNEYTYALKELTNSIKEERSRKVKTKLKEYKSVLESMLEEI